MYECVLTAGRAKRTEIVHGTEDVLDAEVRFFSRTKITTTTKKKLVIIPVLENALQNVKGLVQDVSSKIIVHKSQHQSK